MERGEGHELSAEEKERINAVIAKAEADTGLEFCLIVGSKQGEHAREAAERAFHKIGMTDRPAVLIMVVPHARTLEVVTAHEIQDRLADKNCDEAVEVMTSSFSAGDIVGGLAQGIELLADRAGRIYNDGEHHGPDLPNVVDLDDPDLN